MPHHQLVNPVLALCPPSGITLNADVLVIVTSAAQFCRLALQGNGIVADPEEVRTVEKFATPANITDLGSFQGFVNQMAEFSPDIAAAAQLLRLLMDPRHAFM